MNFYNAISVISSIFICVCLTVQLQAQVSGTVFNDYDASGVLSGAEPGYPGITITGYGADGTVYGPVSSAADGTYTLTGVNQATRIEFTWPTPGPEPTVFGGSTVQFVSGAASSIDLGIADPYYICAEPNPDVILTCFVNGEAVGTDDAIIRLPWAATGTSPTINSDGNVGQVGAVWGTAYDRVGEVAYSSAFLKRHVEIANSFGSIYLTDYSGATPMTSSTPIIDISNAGSLPPRGLTGVSGGTTSRDPDAFTQIGKIGIGGVEVSRDGSMLWAVNLNTKSIVPVTNLTTTPSEGTPIAIPDPGCSGNSDDWRPFGLKYHNDALYVGGVCSGENGGASTMRYYVYAYDLKTSSWSTALIDESLDYTKGYAFKLQCDEWNPWITSWSEIGYVEGDHDMCHPQAILSDISFDTDGDMIIHFMDRLGHQAGAENICTAGCTDNNLYTAIVGGDILRADFDGIGWSIESGGNIGSDGCGTSGTNNGTSIPEYYCGDFFDRSIQNIGFGDHFETMQGSGVILAGTDEIVTIAIDPLDVNSAGLIYMNNTSGAQTDQAEIYNTGTSTTTTFGKANGLGELDILCSVAPVEIGNYVWIDSDSDGVQDADESGISGVLVELYDPTSMMVISTTTTDANGNYIFSTAMGTNSSSQVYGLNLDFGSSYEVRIVGAEGGSQQGVLSGLEITSINNDSSTNGDARDSDGSDADNSTVVFTLGAPGENDHTYDFGFRPAIMCDNPTYTIATAMGTCSGTTANNDATISLSGIVDGDEANISAGSSYSGPSYGDASNTNTNGGSASFANLMHNTNYTVRVWNMEDVCFNDMSITTPDIDCSTPPVPCDISSIALTSNTCVDNSTNDNPSDDRVSVGILVQGTGTASNYTVSVDNGTTISPMTGVYGTASFFELGPGTAGSGNMYTITVTDADDPLCTTSLSVTAPDNCSPVIPCQSDDCFGVTIEVNVNN